MSKPLTPYIVNFQDTLRISVAVRARSPQEAEQQAVCQWSKDLWQKADLALVGADSEIIESFSRDFFEVEVNPFAQPETNESSPS